jgi:parvulin-like peptidyl-prolyl isomerase
LQALDIAAIRVNGETVGLHALIQRVRAREQTFFIDDAVNAALVREAARQLDIEVTKAEAQKAANDFREKHQLLKAQDAIAWLEQRGLTVADWQFALQEDVLIEKFKSARFDPKAASYFAEHKLEFDRATVGRIASPGESMASELLLQIREEGAVFEDVARKYSTDKKTRDVGGYVGRVRRKDLGASASSAVFGGKEGSIHGPFKLGKDYYIFRVIALHPAVLDDETRAMVKERMFLEWLEDTRAKAKIEIPLFEGASAVVETT